MKQALIKRVIIVCSIALVCLFAAVFIIQTLIMKNTAADNEFAKLEEVIVRLAEIDEATKTHYADFVAKADALAEIVALDQSVLESNEELYNIAKKLEVEHLHITDENGVILLGTVPEYYRSDFASAAQAEGTLTGTGEPSMGIYLRYKGDSATGDTGIIQIGITPADFQEQMKMTDIRNMLKDITVGNNGYIMAVRKADGIVVAHKDNSAVGKNYADIGVTEKLIKGADKAVAQINGVKALCSAADTDEYVLIAVMEIGGVYAGRGATVVIFAIAMLAMFGAVVVILSKTVDTAMLKGMDELMADINAISSGDLDREVSVRTCPEFASLSEGINAMLASVKDNVAETAKINEKEQQIIDETTIISKDIKAQASEMQAVTARLSEGSASQAEIVRELSVSVGSVTEHIRSNADSAKAASRISDETAKIAENGVQKLAELQTAMTKIGQSSEKIANIVKTIEDIAFQTNILALNAAVEAARAGQHGKGFAVVADDVRNLATKSAEATKGTSLLIEETRCAVKTGSNIAVETAEQLRSMMKGIEDSNVLIDDIAVAAQAQEAEIRQISDSMVQISAVIEQNAEISAEAENAARDLDISARSLTDIFTN